MKVIRAIKIIAFIGAIICLLVSCAGNFFILKDACDNDIKADEVCEKLDKYDFSIGSIFKGKAEESTGDDGGSQPGSSDDWSIIPPTGDDNPGDDPATPEDPADLPTGEIVPEGYQAGKHIGIVNGLMIAGNAQINLGFLKDVEIDLTKCGLDKLTLRGEFEVNLWLLISYGLLTVAFILHLISKNRIKTFWSIVLMLFGYLLFTAFFALGQLLANLNVDSLIAKPIADLKAYRIYVIAGCTALGALLGLGYLRCGSRAMKRRKRKNGVRR